MKNTKLKLKSNPKGKSDRIFNSTERNIIKYLYDCRAPSTIYEIAKGLGISYPTAKKYVEKIKISEVFKVAKEDKNKTMYVFNIEAFQKDHE